MRKIALILLALLASSLAQAQTTVRQTGSVTPGHVATWTTNGVIQDGGTAAQGFISSLGITNNGGPGLCLSSAQPTAAGRNQLCFSVTTNGGVEISSYAYGTATQAGITFDINGSVQGFPAVTLPVANNNGACFDGTTGLLKDCGFAPLPGTLPDGKIFIGNASNVPAPQNMSGACTITSAGVLTCNADTILSTLGTTQGSVLYRSASGWVALGPGTTGQVLTSGGTSADVTWTTATGTGTVTSVVCGTGLTGGTITISGTCAVDKASAANYFAGTANKVPTTDVIYPTFVSVTYGTTTTFDFSTFINAYILLTGNITTMTFSNVIAGKSGMIEIQQDGGGSRTTVWNSILKWPGGLAPSLSTSPNAVDILFYNCITASYCIANLVKNVS